MQMKYILLCVLLQIGACFTSGAQEQPAKKGCSCSFSSINQLGVLNGTWGVGGLVQSVNGVRYKTWFAGVGAGIDVYKRGSIPVFLDVRKDLFNTPATPFIYVDAGVHFPDKKIVSENQWTNSEYAKGFYSDAGIGYRMGKKTRSGFLASAGYSYKYVKRLTYYTPCGFGGCDGNAYTYRSYLHRISIKLGWQL